MLEAVRSSFICYKLLFYKITILVLIILASCVQVNGDTGDENGYTFQHPEECVMSKNETFSWNILACTKCQWKQENLPNYCACPDQRFKAISASPNSKIGDLGQCLKCPDSSMLYDNLHCIKCSNLNPYSTTTEKCQPCPNGHIEVAYDLDGTLKNELQCVKCADGFRPSGTSRRCIPCHPSFLKGTNGTCACPEVSHEELDGICFSNSELSVENIDRKSLFKIEYDSFKYDSPFFRLHLLGSFYLCKGKQNQTACQMLANMCTLNLHSYGEDWTACRLYRSAVTGPVSHPPNFIPKIYYSDVEAPSVLIRASSIPNEHTFDYSSPASDVNLTFAKFSFDGKFLGLANLEKIFPCKKPGKVFRASQKFGTNLRIFCQAEIKEMWNSLKETIFLDPYVSYLNGENNQNKIKLYPIPIKIENMKRNGIKVNMLEDKYQWQLVRRFFIMDTLGGKQSSIGRGNGGESNTPKIVRFLRSLHVKIQLQNSHIGGKVYAPLLIATYQDVNQDFFMKNKIVKFEYIVDYFMDMSRAIEDVKIALGVISALAVVWSAIKAWSWNRRNGQLEIDLTTITNLILTCCGNLADSFFIVCFSTALFWFIFFKKQASVHVILPDPNQEKLVRDLLISAFTLKIVAIADIVRKQASIDIFFIDWERPKFKSNTVPTAKSEKPSQQSDHDESVSIWRTYFIANEWNEIQVIRKINTTAQLIITLLFLEVIGMKHWGLHWPLEKLNPDPELLLSIPYSTVSRFVTTVIVFGAIGIIQWLYRIIIHERYFRNYIQDFVDLCTMGNISVFILATKQQGYYIHGRSVHGFADTDMQTMIEQLYREEEDLCGRRGLLPQTDQQTFLISVPSTFRNVYDQVLRPLYSSVSTSAMFAKSRQVLGQGNATKSANAINLSVHAYNSMNRFLTAFLEHALSDLDYNITKKTFFESIFDMEFKEVGNDNAVFYNDDGHSFDNVLFYGHERSLFLFNLYTFIFIDILSHDYVLAAVVVYLLNKVLNTLRCFLGKRNLANKTLIDARFLI